MRFDKVMFYIRILFVYLTRSSRTELLYREITHEIGNLELHCHGMHNFWFVVFVNCYPFGLFFCFFVSLLRALCGDDTTN